MLPERGTRVKAKKLKKISRHADKPHIPSHKSAGKSAGMPEKGRSEGSFQDVYGRRILQAFKGMTDNVVLLIFLVFLIVVILVSGIARNNQQDPEENAGFDDARDSGLATAEAIGKALEPDLNGTIASMNYSELKEELGITDSEFFVLFKDEQGNLIEVDDKPCIGSPQARVNGRKCS